VLSRWCGGRRRRTDADKTQIREETEMAISEFNRPPRDESLIISSLGDLSASVQQLSGLSQLATLAFNKAEPTNAHEEAEKYLAGELVRLSSDLRGQLGRLAEALGRKEATTVLRTQDGSEVAGAGSSDTG
jgi:hypothetical protein